MNSIILDEVALKKRRLALEKMFRPLTPTRRVEIFYRGIGPSLAIGLGTYGAELRATRHRTRVPNVYMNYFEIWERAVADFHYALEKAYLHLDEPLAGGEDVEILALHCDPGIPSTVNAYKYKRGPHFHLVTNRPDFRKAHIGTCMTSLEQTCSSADSLTVALGTMVNMIDDEILDRL